MDYKDKAEAFERGLMMTVDVVFASSAYAELGVMPFESSEYALAVGRSAAVDLAAKIIEEMEEAAEFEERFPDEAAAQLRDARAAT